ncbi:MAG: glutamate synthase-related protein, partial [Microvirga sp.]
MTEPGARKPTKPAAGNEDEVVRREKTSAPAPRGHAPKRSVRDPGLPARQGLYDPKNEKDSCGVGFIADMKNVKSHAIVEQGLAILRNLAHRGAVGADPMMGDGCGILVQIPHRFFAEECAAIGIALPEPGQYGVGHLFMPRDKDGRQVAQKIIEKAIKDEGLTLLGWRDVPVDNTELGRSVKATEPVHKQIFIASPKPFADVDAFERRLFIVRKVISNAVYDLKDERTTGYYPVCLSSRTVVYKGMVLVTQLGSYYKDLQDERFESALALVHQRFATNTFPTWQLAHPYRMIAHNGEINTLRGNVNWMAARQASVDSELFGNDISKLWPISYEGQSDTACFDNALEFLVRGGYPLAHAMMMLIPEAWAGNPLMDEDRRAFYEYHAALMEPWDGPAAIAFSDGRQIGATLDRNGLRPARYLVTRDGLVVMASEMGVLPIPEETIVEKWRLQPGKMLLIDLEQGRIVSDDDIKKELAARHPYKDWLRRTQIVLEALKPVQARESRTDVSLLDRQQAFGYTQEDLKLLMQPMAITGQEAVGSMGTDTPISALSDRPKLLYTYFKQNFAQVTNPPIDPIREEIVMSLVSIIGPRPNLFDLEGTSQTKRLEVRQPILANEDLEKIRAISDVGDGHFKSITLDMTWPAVEGATGMAKAIDSLSAQAEQAVRDGINIIILSDRKAGTDRVPMPSLLGCAAVHHHLIRQGLRTSVGLVVESAEPREVHHFGCLAGYGAEAINPYLAFETLVAMSAELPGKIDKKEIVKRYIKAIDKGLLKVMSKMGISTYQSYCGAQIFDAVGLKAEFVNKYFTGTATRIEGVGLAEIAEEAVHRHRDAFGDSPVFRGMLDVGGEYAVRVRGEDHVWNSTTVSTLQHAVRGNSQDKYRAFAKVLNEQDTLVTIRGLFRVKTAAEDERKPVPIEEVEPAKNIVKRFATGAMSLGSISTEAHATLAVAMNRIGGKSNTGEGGEDPARYRQELKGIPIQTGQTMAQIIGRDVVEVDIPLQQGDSLRSRIKQVASGRFGVTAEYLVSSDQLQIKMAQGAKPGEGGQLPGGKVSKYIGKLRYSVPGVGLISPPPHHDIYSIEDLAQLIHDLKNVATHASISVKLVSEVGVGTIAAGVAKCKADHVVIAGHDGGTGASPWSSIKHAGSPWEIGLAETQQTLVLNRLRGRIRVQADGQMKTGRDVVIGALLGADEFGFATAPLVAEGCIMMRKCHLNTCPVGVATQDPVLRKKFEGKPEHVVNYFFFVAEEAREIMAQLGVRKLDELIGRTELLDTRKGIVHWKAQGLDFSRVFAMPRMPQDVARLRCESQAHGLEKALDNRLIELAQAAIERREKVTIEIPIRNINRTAGTMLSYEIAKRYGHEGLADDTIHVRLAGSAGQRIGALHAQGVTHD